MSKFKVGDRVKDKHGNRGIVVGIQDDDAGPFGPPPSKYGAILRIKTDDGKTGYLEEANASLANSRATNANFDDATFDSNGYRVAVKDLVRVKPSGRSGVIRHISKDGEEVEIAGMGMFHIDEIEALKKVPFKNSRACNSQNPIVANAMNACGTARNAVEDDPEAKRRLDSFWKKVSALKREAEDLDKYLVGRKHYGYSGVLESISRALDR